MRIAGKSSPAAGDPSRREVDTLRESFTLQRITAFARPVIPSASRVPTRQPRRPSPFSKEVPSSTDTNEHSEPQGEACTSFSVRRRSSSSRNDRCSRYVYLPCSSGSMSIQRDRIYPGRGASPESIDRCLNDVLHRKTHHKITIRTPRTSQGATRPMAIGEVSVTSTSPSGSHTGRT